MVDLSKTMYKLQTALKQKGVLVYINTSQFYSAEQDRFVKMYKVIYKKQTLINTASQIKAVEVLNNLWREIKDEKGN